MLEIDGAQGSGSGTIVRFAVALSALLGRPVRLVTRDSTAHGLGCVRSISRPSVPARSCAVPRRRVSRSAPGILVHAGAAHSRWYLRMGHRHSRLGHHAGTEPASVACLAEAPLIARLTGGVFQDFAPSPFHLQHVLAPLLGRMGAKVELRLLRPGYVPRGGGIVELLVAPAREGLTALDVQKRGVVSTVHGVALSSHLEARRVSERMAWSCEERLTGVGLAVGSRVHDTLAARAGAGLAVWTESSTGCPLGADRAGARGRSSEAIGRFVAERLLDDLATDATVDHHAADQVVVFAALARGMSNYVVPCRTNTSDGNLWLVRQFGVGAECEGRRVTITGLGLRR